MLIDELNGNDSFAFYHEPGAVIEKQRSFSNITEDLAIGLEKKMNGSLSHIDKLQQFIQTTIYEWACKHQIEPEQLKALLIRWRNESFSKYYNIGQVWEGTQHILGCKMLEEIILFLVNELKANNYAGFRYRNEVQRTIQIIQANLEGTLTLSGIANQVGLSPNYIGRLFREEVGESFNEFTTRLRIEKAIELLKTTNLKIYEIADRVGIPSYRYFSALFREWTERTPKEFRKEGERWTN